MHQCVARSWPSSCSSSRSSASAGWDTWSTTSRTRNRIDGSASGARRPPSPRVVVPRRRGAVDPRRRALARPRVDGSTIALVVLELLLLLAYSVRPSGQGTGQAASWVDAGYAYVVPIALTLSTFASSGTPSSRPVPLSPRSCGEVVGLARDRRAPGEPRSPTDRVAGTTLGRSHRSRTCHSCGPRARLVEAVAFVVFMVQLVDRCPGALWTLPSRWLWQGVQLAALRLLGQPARRSSVIATPLYVLAPGDARRHPGRAATGRTVAIGAYSSC